jgi:hypothetical protein
MRPERLRPKFDQGDSHGVRIAPALRLQPAQGDQSIDGDWSYLEPHKYAAVFRPIAVAAHTGGG